MKHQFYEVINALAVTFRGQSWTIKLRFTLCTTHHITLQCIYYSILTMKMRLSGPINRKAAKTPISTNVKMPLIHQLFHLQKRMNCYCTCIYLLSQACTYMYTAHVALICLRYLIKKKPKFVFISASSLGQCSFEGSIYTRAVLISFVGV